MYKKIIKQLILLMLIVCMSTLLTYKVMPDSSTIVFNDKKIPNIKLNNKNISYIKENKDFFSIPKNIESGSYAIDIYGKNLDNCEYILHYNNRKAYISYNFDIKTSNKVRLYFNINKKIKNFEIKIHNTDKYNAKISNILLKPYIEYTFLFYNNQYCTYCNDKNSTRTLYSYGSSYFPIHKFDKGTYIIETRGENLNNTFIYPNIRNNNLFYSTDDDYNDTKKLLYILNDSTIIDLEVYLYNNSESNIIIDSLKLKPIEPNDILEENIFPKNIKRIYIQDNILNNNPNPLFIKSIIKNKIKVKTLDNISIKDKMLLFFSRNTLIMTDTEKYNYYKKFYRYYIQGNLFISKYPQKELENTKYIKNFSFKFYDNNCIDNGYDKDNVRYLYQNGHSWGPYINLKKGYYIIDIKGKNIINNLFELTTDSGINNINYVMLDKNKNKNNIKIFFKLDKKVEDFELSIINNKNDISQINGININNVENIKTKLYINSNIKRVIKFNEKPINNNDLELYILIKNIKVMQMYSNPLLFKALIPVLPNSLWIINKKSISYFKYKNLHYYYINKNDILISKNKIENLKEYKFKNEGK